MRTEVGSLLNSMLSPQLEDVLHALDSTASGISSRQNLPSSLTPQRVATWAKAVASRIRQRSPLAQKVCSSTGMNAAVAILTGCISLPKLKGFCG